MRLHRTKRRERSVVVHYHFFKNAGTSVDRALENLFGASWRKLEHPVASQLLTPRELTEYVQANPTVQAISSHTVALPAPSIDGVRILPLLFVRHPIDRARSVYDFERQQVAETAGARAAKELTFDEYVNWRLDRVGEGDWTIANFQTHRLAPSGQGSSSLDCAVDALTRLPFVGLVEAYDQAIQRMAALLSSAFGRISIPVFHSNSSSSSVTLAERLKLTETRLGAETAERLWTANQLDVAVWSRLAEAYHLSWVQDVVRPVEAG
jgi:Sulfotransferase family